MHQHQIVQVVSLMRRVKLKKLEEIVSPLLDDLFFHASTVPVFVISQMRVKPVAAVFDFFKESAQSTGTISAVKAK